jgi:tRNA (guanine-N7-)-methyltransferase
MSDQDTNPPPERRNFYGRIRGKTLRASQKDYLENDLGPLTLGGVTREDNPARAVLDLSFAQGKPLWLEIGFGGGEHMAGQAGRDPDLLIIGVEPFLNGVASALRHVQEGALTNVKVHQGDAREVAGRLPDGCLDRIFILFPDPWPKSRHHKRRIIQSEFLVELHRLLKPGGRLRFATDWAAYADWTLDRMKASGLFTGPIGDTAVPPVDHLTTRYEEKKLGDCAPVFLDFERV